MPYTKTNNTPLYIHTKSNHPSMIIKKLTWINQKTPFCYPIRQRIIRPKLVSHTNEPLTTVGTTTNSFFGFQHPQMLKHERKHEKWKHHNRTTKVWYILHGKIHIVSHLYYIFLMNEIKVYQMALALNKQARNRRKKGIFRSEKNGWRSKRRKVKTTASNALW